MRMENCKYDKEINILINEVPRIAKKIEDIDCKISQTKDLLTGINTTKPGLVHIVLSNKRAIGVLFWVLGIIAAVLISGSVKLIFFP